MSSLAHQLTELRTSSELSDRRSPTWSEQPPFLFAPAPHQLPRQRGGSSPGSVTATVGAIIPTFDGVDPGCGTLLSRTRRNATELPRSTTELGERLADALAGGGHGMHSNLSASDTLRTAVQSLETAAVAARFEPDELTPDWRGQLGSLGPGNHFAEIAVDDVDAVVLIVRAGSRDAGAAIAEHHVNVARQLSQRYAGGLTERELPYFVEGTPAFDDFIRQTVWSQQFAEWNRRVLMDAVSAVLNQRLGTKTTPETAAKTTADNPHPETIDSRSNSVRREHHRGRTVWVTRRGAIDAHLGALGVIPAAHGANRYLVEGQGDHSSLCSFVHGRFRPAQTTGQSPRAQESANDVRSALEENPQAVVIRQVLRPLISVTQQSVAIS